MSGDCPLFGASGLSFTLRLGEIVAFSGPSGIGKTRLLRALAQLDKPLAGRMGFSDFSVTPDAGGISDWRTRVLYVPQDVPPLSGTPKSFLQEGRGKMLYYYSICSPKEFIAAKLVFNTMLMILMSLVSLILFYIFLDNPVVNSLQFIGIVILGGTGISLVFTLMSAIAAKAQQNAALIAILGFPVILPQLMLLMKLSKVAFAEVFREGAVLQLAGLTALMDFLVIIMAVILFPFLWKE
jgi:heme exporter protein B